PVERALVAVLAGCAVPERGEQIADRALDRGAPGLALVAAQVLQPLEQRVDLFRLLAEMLLALGGQGEDLARSLALGFLDQAHVLEHGESRIDDARARRVGAVGHLLDRADEVVAVARLVGDQLQQHQPQFARFEHPPAPALAAPAAPVRTPAIAPAAAPAAPVAAKAHGEDAGNVDPALAAIAAHSEPHRHGETSIQDSVRYIFESGMVKIYLGQ